VVKSGNALTWYPAECDVSIRPGWFYHASEDAKVKSLATLADIYFKSVGRNSVLLLNIPPDRHGRIAGADVARLKELRAFIDQLYATDFAKAANALPIVGSATGSMELDLGRPQTFNVARIQEDIALGERVQAYHVEVLDGQNWRTVTSGHVIGHKQLRRFPAVTAQRVRLVIDKASAPAAIAGFGLHFNPVASAGSGALTANRPATASDVHPGGTQYGADKAVDDDAETRWATSDGTKQAWLEVQLADLSTMSRLVIKEYDPRLTKFQLQYRASPDEIWKVAYEGAKAGKNFSASFPAVKARFVRLNILDSTLPPTIWEFQVFK
jgi:alpha-L-fucosidase